MTNFDIFGQIGKELQSFRDDNIFIAGKKPGGNAKYLQNSTKGWQFNQGEMVDLIELYYNSKFENGLTDAEGYRKLFLNICAFRADVAAMRIDLDVKDFVFIPDGEVYKWGTYFLSRKFKDWARENYFGETINELVENYPRYGTLVVKKIGKTVHRVPLRNLVNQQDAKDLKTATHVIELHKDMTMADMEKFQDWDTEGLDLPYGKTVDVYERYGRVPTNWYYEKKGINKMVGENETIDVVCICTLKERKDNKDMTGSILFIEEVKERPYEEVHWKKQDGRWLGIGEVETQLENQIARNTLANLRRRALLWASKKVFQSADDTIAKNLVRDVKDGEVLKITPNGNNTQIDKASTQIGEFQSAENMWEQNSDQKSFTFEVATGETMPSGTPFRLGVVLSNAVNSHFGLKREKLGLFLKRVVLEQVLQIFKKENRKAHTLMITATDKGFNNLRKVASEIEYNKRVMDWALSDAEEVPDFKLIQDLVEEEYGKKKDLFIEIPDRFYDDIKHGMTIAITGESIDVPAKIESLTTLYQTLLQSGDPRADQVLEKIFALTGENLEATLGKAEPQQVQAPQQAPQESVMNQLANLNAPQEQQPV